LFDNRPTLADGIGVENGLPGLREFTDVHVIYQARRAGGS
jgi:hypothetical protein